jgi:type II secretory pathway pseudopilin PulG
MAASTAHCEPVRRRARIAPAVQGFAYLWVLLLVAFMGVGLVVGVETSSVAVQRDKERELLAIGHQFRAALKSYKERGAAGPQLQGYPPSLDALLLDNRAPGITRHLRQVFVDPMTGKAEWGLVMVGGRIAGVYSLSEAKAIKQANFDDEDLVFTGQEHYNEWVFAYPSNLVLRPDGTTRGSAGSAASAASAALPGTPGTGFGGASGMSGINMGPNGNMGSSGANGMNGVGGINGNGNGNSSNSGFSGPGGATGVTRAIGSAGGRTP